MHPLQPGLPLSRLHPLLRTQGLLPGLRGHVFRQLCPAHLRVRQGQGNQERQVRNHY